MTPLHLAVESDRINIVSYLLDQKADINSQDDNGVMLYVNAGRIPDSLIPRQVLYHYFCCLK